MAKKKRAAASVYRWKQRFFVHPLYVHRDLSVAAEPVVKLPDDAATADLGLALWHALQASALIRREPDAAEMARVLKALGGRSWGAVDRAARCLHVSLERGELCMTPLIYWDDEVEHARGLRGEEQFTVSGSSTEDELGELMRRLTEE